MHGTLKVNVVRAKRFVSKIEKLDIRCVIYNSNFVSNFTRILGIWRRKKSTGFFEIHFSFLIMSVIFSNYFEN